MREELVLKSMQVRIFTEIPHLSAADPGSTSTTYMPVRCSSPPRTLSPILSPDSADNSTLFVRLKMKITFVLTVF